MTQIANLEMLAQRNRALAMNAVTPLDERLTYLNRAKRYEEAAEQERDYRPEQEEVEDERFVGNTSLALIALCCAVFWWFAIRGIWYVVHLCMGWKLVKP